MLSILKFFCSPAPCFIILSIRTDTLIHRLSEKYSIYHVVMLGCKYHPVVHAFVGLDLEIPIFLITLGSFWWTHHLQKICIRDLIIFAAVAAESPQRTAFTTPNTVSSRWDRTEIGTLINIALSHPIFIQPHVAVASLYLVTGKQNIWIIRTVYMNTRVRLVVDDLLVVRRD